MLGHVYTTLVIGVKKVTTKDACQIIADWNADVSPNSHNSELTKNSKASPDRNHKVDTIGMKVKNGYYQFKDDWENSKFITKMPFDVYSVMKNPEEKKRNVVGQIYFSTHDQFGENPRLPSLGIIYF